MLAFLASFVSEKRLTLSITVALNAFQEHPNIVSATFSNEEIFVQIFVVESIFH